jgi:hypothetical protein
VNSDFDTWLTSNATKRWTSLELPALLTEFPNWVNRRVETLGILSETQFTRHNSIDLIISRRLTSFYSEDTCVVPLAFLYKRYLRQFDIVDEEGTAIPILTERESNRLVLQMLQYLAYSVLARAELKDRFAVINEDLSKIPGPLGEATLNQLQTNNDWDLLLADSVVGKLLTTLSVSFVLFAVIKAREGERRIVKYTYEHQFTAVPKFDPWQSSLRWLGWVPLQLSVDGVLPTASASYHAEVEAPPGSAIATAELEVAESGQQLDYDKGDPRIAHLHFVTSPPSSQADAAVATTGTVRVNFGLYPSHNQILRQVARSVHLVTGILISAVVLKQLELHQVVPNLSFIPQAASSILIAVPAVVAFYLAVQEHPVIQNMVYGTMVRAGISAGLAFAAAASLSLNGFPPGTRLRLWEVLAAASLVNSLIIMVTRMRAGRRSTGMKKES